MNAYGRDDLMAVAAFRYSLGRMTYIVSDCAHWLCEQWPNIAENARKVIQRDLEEAFKRDDEARADGQYFKPLGHDWLLFTTPSSLGLIWCSLQQQGVNK